jgi:hypothetical protein
MAQRRHHDQLTAMPLRDYEELDEDDFYGQGFGRRGVVSVWLGTEPPGPYNPKLDVLQDLCGVGFYDHDFTECNIVDAASPIRAVMKPLSYSRSYVPAVVKAAAKRKIAAIWWVFVQYDFAYNPKRVKRAIADQPIFLGFFRYKAEDEPLE